MRNLTLRRLFGIAGLTVLLGAVAFTAYGATFNCTGQATCTGTGFGDTINDDDDVTSIIYGLGGNDTIVEDGDFDTDATLDQVFAGPGNDSIKVSSGGSALIFGEDGDDFIDVTESGNSTIDGGRGHDIVLVKDVGDSATVIDGPGRDTIRNTDDGNHTIQFVADNEADTYLGDYGSEPSNAVTITLDKGSGRDVIDCGGSGTLFLKGNRKAVDTKGNNLRQAALLGGVAQSNCDTIIP